METELQETFLLNLSGQDGYTDSNSTDLTKTPLNSSSQETLSNYSKAETSSNDENRINLFDNSLINFNDEKSDNISINNDEEHTYICNTTNGRMNHECPKEVLEINKDDTLETGDSLVGVTTECQNEDNVSNVDKVPSSSSSLQINESEESQTLISNFISNESEQSHCETNHQKNENSANKNETLFLQTKTSSECLNTAKSAELNEIGNEGSKSSSDKTQDFSDDNLNFLLKPNEEKINSEISLDNKNEETNLFDENNVIVSEGLDTKDSDCEVRQKLNSNDIQHPQSQSDIDDKNVFQNDFNLSKYENCDKTLENNETKSTGQKNLFNFVNKNEINNLFVSESKVLENDSNNESNHKEEVTNNTSDVTDDLSKIPVPRPKKRGRKRKYPVSEVNKVIKTGDDLLESDAFTAATELLSTDLKSISETESEKDLSDVIKPRRRGRAKKNPDIIPSHLTADDLILGYKILLKFYETPQFSEFHCPYEYNSFDETTENKVTCLNHIKQKFDDNLYKGITEFINDVREMLFIVYESKNVVATKRALRLEQLLDQRIAQLPKDLRQKCVQEFSADDTNSNNKKNRMNKGGGYVSLLLEKAERSRSEKDKEKRRLQAEERKQLKEEQDKDIQEWEKCTLLGASDNDVKSMWELPQIGLFVHICRELLNIGEISQYEIERILLMCQCSSTLDLLVTALLSNSLVRAKLDRTPAMPYSIWSPILRTRVSAWYRAWHRESKNGQKLFEEIGIEPEFWEVLGTEVNLLDHYYFHELSLHQRVWVLKTLCDVDFVRKKTVYDNIRAQSLDELSCIDLGMDRHGNRYVHFKQFCGPDLRIYRQKMELGEGMEVQDLIESSEGFEIREGPITNDKVFRDIWDIGDKFDKNQTPVKRRRQKKKRLTRVNMKEEEIIPKKNLRVSARSKQKIYVDYSDSDQSDTDLQTLKKKLCQPGKESLYKPFSEKEFISLNVFRLPREKAIKSTPKKSGYIKKSDLAANAVEIKENQSDLGTDISNTDSNSKINKCDFSKIKDENKEENGSKCLGFDEEAMDSLDLKQEDTQLEFEKNFAGKEDMDDEFFDFEDKISSFTLNKKQNFTVQNLENLKMVFKKGDECLEKDMNSDESNLLLSSDKLKDGESKTDNNFTFTYEVPTHMKPDSEKFYLVVDSIDSLKQLISKFSSDDNDLEIISRSTRKSMKQQQPRQNTTPSCEVQLIERLQNLLTELEPWEIDFLKSSRNSRDKLYKEFVSFTNRPEDYVHPNEAYWMKLYEDTPPVTTTVETSLQTTSSSSSLVKSEMGTNVETFDVHTEPIASTSMSTPTCSDLGLRKRKRVTRIQLKVDKDDELDEEFEEDTLESSESDDNWEMPTSKKRAKKDLLPKLIKEKPKRSPLRKCKTLSGSSSDVSCQGITDKSTQSSPQDKKKTLFWGSRSSNPSDDLDWETNRQKILEKHNSSGVSPPKKIQPKSKDENNELEILSDKKVAPSTPSRFFPLIPGNKKPYFSPAQLKAMEKKTTVETPPSKSGGVQKLNPMLRQMIPQPGRPPLNPTGTQQTRMPQPRGVSPNQLRMGQVNRSNLINRSRQVRPLTKTNVMRNSSTQSVEVIDISQEQQMKNKTETTTATAITTPGNSATPVNQDNDLFITDGNVLIKADETFIKQFMQGDKVLTINLNQSLDMKKPLFIVKPTTNEGTQAVLPSTSSDQKFVFIPNKATEAAKTNEMSPNIVMVQKNQPQGVFLQQQQFSPQQQQPQLQQQQQQPQLLQQQQLKQSQPQQQQLQRQQLLQKQHKQQSTLQGNVVRSVVSDINTVNTVNNVIIQTNAGQEMKKCQQVEPISTSSTSTSSSVILHTNLPLPAYKNINKEVQSEIMTTNSVLQLQQPLQTNQNIVVVGNNQTQSETLKTEVDLSSLSEFVVPNVNNTYTLMSNTDNINVNQNNMETFTILRSDKLEGESDQNFTIIQCSDGVNATPTLAIVQKQPSNQTEMAGIPQQLFTLVNANSGQPDLILTPTSLRFTNPNQANTSVRPVSQPILMKTNVGRVAQQTPQQVITKNTQVRQVVPHKTHIQPQGVSNLRFIRPQNMPTNYRNVPLAGSATPLQTINTRPTAVLQYQNTTGQKPLTQQQPVRLFTANTNQVRNVVPSADANLAQQTIRLPSGQTIQQRFVTATNFVNSKNVIRPPLSAAGNVPVQQLTGIPRQITGPQTQVKIAASSQSGQVSNVTTGPQTTASVATTVPVQQLSSMPRQLTGPQPQTRMVVSQGVLQTSGVTTGQMTTVPLQQLSSMPRQLTGSQPQTRMVVSQGVLQTSGVTTGQMTTVPVQQLSSMPRQLTGPQPQTRMVVSQGVLQTSGVTTGQMTTVPVQQLSSMPRQLTGPQPQTRMVVSQGVLQTTGVTTGQMTTVPVQQLSSMPRQLTGLQPQTRMVVSQGVLQTSGVTTGQITSAPMQQSSAIPRQLTGQVQTRIVVSQGVQQTSGVTTGPISSIPIQQIASVPRQLAGQVQGRIAVPQGVQQTGQITNIPVQQLTVTPRQGAGQAQARPAVSQGVQLNSTVTSGQMTNVPVQQLTSVSRQMSGPQQPTRIVVSQGMQQTSVAPGQLINVPVQQMSSIPRQISGPQTQTSISVSPGAQQAAGLTTGQVTSVPVQQLSTVVPQTQARVGVSEGTVVTRGQLTNVSTASSGPRLAAVSANNQLQTRMNTSQQVRGASNTALQPRFIVATSGMAGASGPRLPRTVTNNVSGTQTISIPRQMIPAKIIQGTGATGPQSVPVRFVVGQQQQQMRGQVITSTMNQVRFLTPTQVVTTAPSNEARVVTSPLKNKQPTTPRSTVAAIQQPRITNTNQLIRLNQRMVSPVTTQNTSNVRFTMPTGGSVNQPRLRMVTAPRVTQSEITYPLRTIVHTQSVVSEQTQQNKPINVRMVQPNSSSIQGQRTISSTPVIAKVPVLSQTASNSPILIRIEEDDDIKIIDENDQDISIVSERINITESEYDFDESQVTANWQTTDSDTNFVTQLAGSDVEH